MASSNNIKKLLGIDGSIKSTTDPNQAIERLGGGVIRLFYNDGNFISRKNNVNNANGQVKGIWYFVGNNNYQIKIKIDGKTNVFDFKTNKTTTFEPPNPNLQKLIDIDSNIDITRNSDMVVDKYFENGKTYYWIYWADGDWRGRTDRFDNKENQNIGTWKLISDDVYQITDTEYNEVWNSNDRKWVKIKKGATWRDVTFTLADVAAGKAVLKKGDRGPAVEELQKLMIQMNLSKVSKSGQPDGKFGKLTELSIRQFQGEMKYGEQDGKVGKNTLNRMYYVYNYDPDKEVDDVQTGEPADVNYLRNPIKLDLGPVPEIPKRIQTSPDDTQNVTTDTKQPELTLPNAEPTTQPKQKLALTPKVVQENIKKIVSENLKSLLK
jgi:peptidoglycan hydrolase-like protein with peptidoglycan-binding domain